MSRVAPYHTNSPEYPPKHREVYHDKDTCPDGKRISANRHCGSLQRAKSLFPVFDLSKAGTPQSISTGLKSHSGNPSYETGQALCAWITVGQEFHFEDSHKQQAEIGVPIKIEVGQVLIDMSKCFKAVLSRLQKHESNGY